MKRPVSCAGGCGRLLEWRGGRGRPRRWCNDCLINELERRRACPRCGYSRADYRDHDCAGRVAKAMAIVERAAKYDAARSAG